MATSTKERPKTLFPLLDDAMERLADDCGIKLELVNGIPIWEAFPAYRHQNKVYLVRASLTQIQCEADGFACISVADLTILFPDGSIKRPDISIFCEQPIEQDTACTQIPKAVIEILSKGYEKKDTEISLPFYLSWNIPILRSSTQRRTASSTITTGKRRNTTRPSNSRFSAGVASRFRASAFLNLD